MFIFVNDAVYNHIPYPKCAYTKKGNFGAVYAVCPLFISRAQKTEI